MKKKYSIHDPKVIDILISKQLEKYDVDYNWVKKNEKNIEEHHGVPWYQHYTFETQKEYDDWKKFCITFLLTQIKPLISVQRANKEFEFFDFAYGLSLGFKKEE